MNKSNKIKPHKIEKQIAEKKTVIILRFLHQKFWENIPPFFGITISLLLLVRRPYAVAQSEFVGLIKERRDAQSEFVV
jgi:hypothetical protein